MKQWAFLSHLTFDEDTFQETFIKVAEIILKRGLKDTTEQGILNYVFTSFKFNTYQTHLQESKQLKDYNINPFDLEIEDIPYNEDNVQYADMAAHYIFKKIKEVFDATTVAIWRLRYMVTIDNQELNYKKIKQMTGIEDTRRRIVMVNKWIRENISQKDINNAIKNQEIFN